MLKQQDVATNHGVELRLECHLGRIAVREGHVAQRPGIRSFPCCRQSGRSSINADNFAGVTDQFRRQERDIADAASEIKYTHAGDDAGLAEELPRDGFEKARLCTQTLELSLGMAKDIGMGVY